MNIGLLMMCVGSLLPVGLLQTWASVDQDYWYARRSEFLHTPLMQNLRWMRAPGDSLFAIGELALVWFWFSLWRPKRRCRSRSRPWATEDARFRGIRLRQLTH